MVFSIHVHETADGRVEARHRELSEIFAPYGNEALSEIGAELDPVFAGILGGWPVNAGYRTVSLQQHRGGRLSDP